ncbi:MAG: arylsulfatase, partial [Planctomycetes bacterium]|nr:arylsulfatase [Planctomycetota bacterium]
MLLGLLAVVSLAHAAKPNIIVILSDDQGWGDLSLNGNTNLSTPNIDSLAKDGAQFERFYVCPVCSPTRAEFLTGRYHPRGGVYSTSAGGERLDLDEMTIADTFKAGGYRTAAFGKWHNGMQFPYHPNARGFDEYYGFCSGHWGNYFDPMLERNGQIVQGECFCIDDFTNKAIQFIEASGEKPFFAYLPFNTPHSPMQVPDRFWNKFKEFELKKHNRDPKRENLGHIRAALAMCENIDWNVGRILKKLDQLKIADNTIVLYFCDNGPNGTRWNGDMKGRKGSTDEGGVRSPLLVRWPAKVKPGTRISTNGAAIDLLPTLADLAGVEVASKKTLDGISLKPWLLSYPDILWPNRKIFSHWRGRVAVRTEEFLLDHQGKLCTVRVDEGQRTDVSREHPEVAEELREAVADWKAEMLPQLEEDNRPFVIAHPDSRFTQIPARDGIAHGGIERSNRFPNCSYFSNWKSLDGKITWTAEVEAPGEYEVEVYYTCPKADVGSEIELSFQGTSLRS